MHSKAAAKLMFAQTDSKKSKKAKGTLDARFQDLGGNAMTRDKKGRITQDDQGMQQEMASAGLGNQEGYEPYVFYEFEVV